MAGQRPQTGGRGPRAGAIRAWASSRVSARMPTSVASSIGEARSGGRRAGSPAGRGSRAHRSGTPPLSPGRPPGSPRPSCRARRAQPAGRRRARCEPSGGPSLRAAGWSARPWRPAAGVGLPGVARPVPHAANGVSPSSVALELEGLEAGERRRTAATTSSQPGSERDGPLPVVRPRRGQPVERHPREHGEPPARRARARPARARGRPRVRGVGERGGAAADVGRARSRPRRRPERRERGVVGALRRDAQASARGHQPLRRRVGAAARRRCGERRLASAAATVGTAV